LTTATRSVTLGTYPPNADVSPRKQASTVPETAVAPTLPRQTDPDLYAIAFLDGIQAQSIADRREFCGFFYRDDTGAVQATTPRKGTFATCSMPAPRRDQNVFASYHTHGAYGAQYDNEVPSVTDLQSDIRLGLNVQLCGLGCVTRDPGFVPRNESAVFSRYTIFQLALRNGA